MQWSESDQITVSRKDLAEVLDWVKGAAQFMKEHDLIGSATPGPRFQRLQAAALHPEVRLYIYLGPGAGYGTINDRPPKKNQYNWYELGAAVSDDPADYEEDDLPTESEFRTSWPACNNPRRMRNG